MSPVSLMNFGTLMKFCHFESLTIRLLVPRGRPSGPFKVLALAEITCWVSHVESISKGQLRGILIFDFVKYFQERCGAVCAILHLQMCSLTEKKFYIWPEGKVASPFSALADWVLTFCKYATLHSPPYIHPINCQTSCVNVLVEDLTWAQTSSVIARINLFSQMMIMITTVSTQHFATL